MRQFLWELGVGNDKEATVLMTDNQGAIALAKESRFSFEGQAH
jgi:hypothetical protein